MSTSLHNPEELILSVRDPNSRSYIEEAVKAFRAGALRAAVITTWTSVAYDLLQKIRELANSGEASAKTLIDHFDNAVGRGSKQELLKIEDTILVKARDNFEMLQPHETTLLERLKEDRHLCAHPAFVSGDVLFQPTPEAVQAHIVHAVEYLLRHEPIQGKSALEKIYRDVTAPALPLDVDLATKYLKKRYLDRAKPSLIRNLVSIILKKLLKEEGSEHDAAFIVALQAISHTRSSEYDSAMRELLPQVCAVSQSDERLLNILALNDIDSRCWDWLDEATQIKVTEVLRKGHLHASYTPQMLQGAMRDANLATLITDEFKNFDSEQQFRIMELCPRPEFAEDAIERFSNAFSFRAAERYGEKLILPMAGHMTSDQIKVVLRAARQNNQIYHAAKMPKILVEFFDKTVEHLPDTSEEWEEFIEFVRDKVGTEDTHYSYPELSNRMTDFGWMFEDERASNEPNP